MTDRTVSWLWLAAMFALMISGGWTGKHGLIVTALTGAVGFGIGRGLRG